MPLWLRRVALILVVSMLVVHAMIAYQLRTPIVEGRTDFVAAYTAGKILQDRQGSRLYDLSLQYQIQRQIGSGARQQPLPYVRPPFEAWLFRMLVPFSYSVALYIWAAINLAFLAAAIVLLRQEIPQRMLVSLPVLVLAALSFFPVFLCFLQGQDSLLLLLIYAAAYKAFRHHRSSWAGAILALGTFKFPLIVPFLLPFVVHRRWRFVAGFSALVVLLAAISLATVGSAGMLQYISYLANIDRLAPGINVPTDMPNLRGLLALAVGEPVPSTLGRVALAGISLAVIGGAATLWTADPENPVYFSTGYSLALVATMLVSYHAHTFDLCLLIVPGCIMLKYVFPDQHVHWRAQPMLALALALLALSPLYLLVALVLHKAAFLAVVLLLFYLAIARLEARGSRWLLSSTSV